ncbi:endonuclease/exonuclease/phosphatase family protein [Aeromonas caviae]
MNFKLGTFNIENLFNRYRLLQNERGSRIKKPVDPEKFVTEGGHINMLGWTIDDYGPISKAARKATARVITENAPDILALQEVENLFALLAFNQKWLENAYPYAMVLDGNDPRGIDVGVLSKYPLGAIYTHRFDPEGSSSTERTFSRDCLEVEILLTPNTPFRLFINHFKSKIGGGEERRQEQALRVVDILRERYGEQLDGNYAVLGDLNNSPDAPELRSLVQNELLVDVVRTRLPADEQWTHYYKKDKSAEQLDYILLSKRVAQSNAYSTPIIERRGLGIDIDKYEGERFSQVTGAQGASDHCAVFIELKL